MTTSPSRTAEPADAAGSGRATIRVRFFAAARAAAGTTELTIQVPPAATVADVLADAVARSGPELAAVLVRCSFLLDQVAVHGRDTPVGSGATLDVLPPFAGG